MIPPESHPNRTRPYHHSGLHVVSKALPYLLERIADPALPDEALSPVEQAARAWRREVVEDLGGPEAVSAAKLGLLGAATGSKIILDSLDRYLFELAETGGLVNRRNRRAFAVVADRMRVADGLTRQLQALGLERRPRKAPNLVEYLASRQAELPGDGAPHPIPAPAQQESPRPHDPGPGAEGHP